MTHLNGISGVESSPIKHLEEILQADSSRPDERLPRIISRLPNTSDQPPAQNVKRWLSGLGAKAAEWNALLRGSWQLVISWSDSWFRVVLTGCVAGLIIGFAYRAALMSN